MKISKLHIDSHKHLENLTFDFTYQSGERKGQPLDKICFIGQSASGKTNLLELISQQHISINSLIYSENFYSHKNDVKILNGYSIFNYDDIDVTISKNSVKVEDIIDSKEYSFIDSGSFSNLLSDKSQKFLFYFKTNLISEKNLELFTKNPIDIFEKHPKLDKRYKIENLYSKEFPVIFDDSADSELWLSLLYEILDYRKKFNQKMSDLIHKGLLANQKKLSDEFDKWQNDNPNTLELFANKFNPILEKLNLEVDIVDTAYSIPIKNRRNDEIIPIQNTSTGTKGLLLSFLPLYKLDTKDSIILIDEPERSLYPDMQMEIMEHYKNFAPEAQFIVATHSPFIAASFEPEERFILEFDGDGKVTVRRGSSPIGDDPNDILKNDFKVNYYNKHGEEAYQKYISLKQEVANETDPKRKKELLLETVKLGDTYNF